ncbi:MAG: hypothetical protein KJ709_06640 [Nanoarchaeota archaeon]|nr:hypothetical protein [Nanoarchaeota archaeon]
MKRLHDKGWTQKEIDHTEKIISKYKKKHRSQEITWFWLTFFILAVFILLISVFFLPVMLITPPLLVSIVMLFVGLVFGFVFEHVVFGMQHLSRRHHAIALIVLPLLAVVKLSLVGVLSNWLRQFLPFVQPQNALIPAMLFVVGFLLPYMVRYWFEN